MLAADLHAARLFLIFNATHTHVSALTKHSDNEIYELRSTLLVGQKDMNPCHDLVVAMI